LKAKNKHTNPIKNRTNDIKNIIISLRIITKHPSEMKNNPIFATDVHDLPNLGFK
jgi:hypothetical protein|tara:strand:+ start:96 stop:260 length:165 start_codon:yes stop_codon:yes gene_type:complete